MFLHVALCLIALVSVYCELSQNKSKQYELESNFYREEPCAKNKGFCVLQNECPGLVVDYLKELCPMQKTEGAVCCKNLPQRYLNCYQLHNECAPNCAPPLLLGKKGCPENTVCCALV